MPYYPIDRSAEVASSVQNPFKKMRVLGRIMSSGLHVFQAKE
jgi:hypothetical protein